jgi:phage tail protein X
MCHMNPTAQGTLMDKLGWKFFAATIGTMGAMFTVFAMLITSSLK